MIPLQEDILLTTEPSLPRVRFSLVRWRPEEGGVNRAAGVLQETELAGAARQREGWEPRTSLQGCYWLVRCGG